MKRKDGLTVSGNWELLVQGENSPDLKWPLYTNILDTLCRPRVQTYQPESGSGPVLGLNSPRTLDKPRNNKDAEWFV